MYHNTKLTFTLLHRTIIKVNIYLIIADFHIANHAYVLATDKAATRFYFWLKSVTQGYLLHIKLNQQSSLCCHTVMPEKFLL
jgi:hypothetical protein